MTIARRAGYSAAIDGLPSHSPESLEARYLIEEVDYPASSNAERWLELGAWRRETIGKIVERAARERPDATAVVDGPERLSYRELERRSRAVAQRLIAIGLEPGDRVLVQVGIGSTAVVALTALFRAALVPVCAVPQYRAFEMNALAELSRARAHLVEPGSGGSQDLLRLAADVQASAPSLRHTLVAGAQAPCEATALEPEDAKRTATAELPSPAPAPADVAAFQLSGGTTGVPKIIPRFHAEYLGYAEAWAKRLQLRDDDVLLWCLPVSHNAGMLCWLLPALLRQATLVLLPRFEAADFLAAIEREGVTVTGSIGPIAPRLLDEERPRRFDLSSVRTFVTLNRARDVEAHLGVRSMNIYGITEGLLTASTADAPSDVRHTTVGRAASPHDEVRVLVLGADREVPSGEVGELCFRGPSSLTAYYRNPQATEAAFSAQGFFRTGDLVRAHVRDGHASLSFEGRAKDNIDRGGEKFGTEEIETLLAGHPAIREVRIVGMPDRYLGERVCAFVIPCPGDPAPNVEELAGFLLERGLAKFKLPERVEPIEDMPVTSVGKLDRVALRRRIVDTLATEESV